MTDSVKRSMPATSTVDKTALFHKVQEAFDFAQQQVRAILERTPDFFPMYTVKGRWKHGGEVWTHWCEGFLPGMMWLFYRQTHDPWWRERAERYSRRIEHRKTDRNVHDLGFLFMSTYRRWYEVTGDPKLNDVLIEAGRTLAQRFQKKGRYLCSFLGPPSLFIDIMMNVGIIFYAAQQTADERLWEIANQHCQTTRRYLIRGDGSTVHEGIFDTATGEFLRPSTQQGWRSDSCWSRGLAWALYGFGTAYRFTENLVFLDTAERCADFYLEHVPEGKVPYWDFDLPPGPARIWDSSAAAIAASGLWNLAELTRSEEKRHRYREGALEIVTTLSSDEFLAKNHPGQEGVLLHAVYHFHKKLGVDESVIWGDYFLVEALTKTMNRLERSG